MTHGDAAGRTGIRFTSLRAKIVLFFSLILVLTSSALSWYFIETRRVAMIENLNRIGTILLTNVVNNGQFRYGALVAEDPVTLHQFAESLMAIDDVVYVVFRGADRMILLQNNKRNESPSANVGPEERRFYPDEQIVMKLFEFPTDTPVMTALMLSPNDKVLIPKVSTAASSLWIFSTMEEVVYDFGLPVLRRPATDPDTVRLPFELEEGPGAGTRPEPPRVLGTVQIGLSDARVKAALLAVAKNVLILTLFIIAGGIIGAHALTLRITTPLRSLASVARKLAEGESPAPLTPTTADEVGQLTRTFNMMTQALKERSLAITSNLETIHRQVTQLTTVHQTSAAITSTLDLNELLDTVLQLLMNNLGLPRMVLMLRHEDTNMAYVAQIAGVPPEIAQRARTLVVPIEDDGTIMAELFVHAKPVLVEDIDAAAHRMHQVVLDLARRTGVRSFVCVPLQTRTQILGFLAGDRGEQVCTAEDLDILLTIAGHVATAIDNARTYANLEALTLNLERRVQEATQELVAANERLQEHDKRRSLFFSVASHELRTPMTAIRSFTDNMLDGVAGPLTEHQTTYLKRIGHNLNRLTRIINQLLDWSRFDLQKETLRIEPLCVGKIAELVAESLRTIAVEKHVEIDVTVQDGLPVIEGDRDKLEQIFWNLIGNAVKFTPEGGRIVVAASTAPDNRVQVSVSDTGCGIAPDALEHVFDEFSKVPSAMPNAQGAQLGLYITKSLVTLHHGTIDVTSVLNGGSRFIVTLPLTQPREEAAESSAPGPAPESQGTAS